MAGNQVLTIKANELYAQISEAFAHAQKYIKYMPQMEIKYSRRQAEEIMKKQRYTEWDHLGQVLESYAPFLASIPFSQRKGSWLRSFYTC